MSLNVPRLTFPRSVPSARRLQPHSLLAFPRVEFHPSSLPSLFRPRRRRRRLRRCRIKPQCWRLILTWLRSGHHPGARDLPGSSRITLAFALSFCFFPVLASALPLAPSRPPILLLEKQKSTAGYRESARAPAPEVDLRATARASYVWINRDGIRHRRDVCELP